MSPTVPVTGIVPVRARDLFAGYPKALKPVWDRSAGLTTQVKVPVSVALWPTRTKCRACRKTFTDLVVLSMFCSYECAGLPAPPADPAVAPRECRRAARPHEETPSGWVFKRRFRTAAEAAEWQQTGTNLYRCSCCWAIHSGHPGTVGPADGTPRVAPDWPSAEGFARCVDALLTARRVSRRNVRVVEEAERDTRAVLLALRDKN